MAMLSSNQLTIIQGLGALAFLLALAGGTIYLVVGLIRPAWVRRAKRRWVVATSLAIWFLGFVVWAGTIAFTHSHPNGPHAAKGYIDRYFQELCAQGRDLPACHEGGAKPPGSASAAQGETPH